MLEAGHSIQVFKDVIVLKERLEREVLPHFSTRRQANAQALVRTLYQSPALSIQRVAGHLNIKINTASALINDFVKRAVLIELTGRQRNRIFLFEEYIMIFKNHEANP